MDLTDYIMRALGLTREQFRILLPGGVDDREGYPGTIVTNDAEPTYKQRLQNQREAEGWKRA